ncbi:glycosyltransferase [Carnobacterium funditum]|uniref:glycosyltransferase n=1 Tax=Carnobacterium funditum TaxID=2752 RepID=UPI0005501CB7|nr:glycosyltransferase [Carnobacterium funditum]
MKKAVFVVKSLSNGGIEHSLVNLINTIEDYEVTLIMSKNHAPLLPLIKKPIKIKYLTDTGQGIDTRIFLKESFVNKQWLSLFRVSWRIGLFLISKNMIPLNNFYLNAYPLEEEEYDIAIAYDGGLRATSSYVIQKIKAKKKIMWVHEDYSKLVEIEKKTGGSVFKYFDQIFCVSKGAKEKFLELYPELSDKTKVFYSIYSKNDFYKKATNQTSDYNYKGIKILTVARLGQEKGHDLIPEVISKLKSEGYQFHWYLVGDDDGVKSTLEKEIKNRQIESYLSIMGGKGNPFPYYRDCDIYVQPSRQEGYCMSMVEAMAFGKPIIATNFLTAKEFILNHGTDGLIADISSQSLYENIKKMLDDENLRMSISKCYLQKKIDTKAEVEKFYAI